MAEIVTTGSFAGAPLHWLPPTRSFSFHADPFGLWRSNRLYVFAERFDYRDRRGRIDMHCYDRTFRLLERSSVLQESWHLSYPFVFEAEGETWMLPEAHHSGMLILYRAVDFPYRWEKAARIQLDHVPVDATPLKYDGLWWLFYTVANDAASKVGELHIAFSEKLTGTWRPHPANPVRLCDRSARPGGTPLVVNGSIMIPVQDCSRTYGGGLRMLLIDHLSPDSFACRPSSLLNPPPGIAPYNEGMHTMAAAGDITLIDVKQTKLTLEGLAIEFRREAGALLRQI